ncbi:hypothetical protein B9Z55_025994 [Caenorhabditis nigoni]|uniref:DDE-1 domain-containing protein n=1 Tax=Caenorhabditis nigoni TaxID=1611254 RepID=A0A2G5T150_9PELO|nr:hypothetical protein B9Z55_025994 [Caenorhabditis nigoni]
MSRSHSYTVLPLIIIFWKTSPKLFVTLKEPKVRLSAKTLPNLSSREITYHTSHIMTKELMKVFFEKSCLNWKRPCLNWKRPLDALVILNSWNSWKDMPTKLKILTIPSGYSGNIQPRNVGIFGSFKKTVKKITNYAQLSWMDPKH